MEYISLQQTMKARQKKKIWQTIKIIFKYILFAWKQEIHNKSHCTIFDPDMHFVLSVFYLMPALFMHFHTAY